MANVLLLNPATVDTVEIYSSGARTATPDSYELSNQRGRGQEPVIVQGRMCSAVWVYTFSLFPTEIGARRYYGRRRAAS